MSISRPTYSHVDSDAPLGTAERYGSPGTSSDQEPSAYDSAGYVPRDLEYPTKHQTRRKGAWLIGGIIFLVVALAVAIPVGITQSRKGGSSALAAQTPSATSSHTGDNSSTPTATSVAPSASASRLAISGKNGSLVKLFSGQEVVYNNTFGGEWAYDADDPIGAKSKVAGGLSQSWVPRIGETWTWGKDVIHGVNLGGWLVLEPFISPGIFEDWRTTPGGADIVDEYTLTAAMKAAGNLTAAMTEHYETFITEQDFMEIAAAGLNFVRIPLGFWALETRGDEPFLPRVSWNYFLKAIEWARKYGIRINLDLHALPGSQNGWNHSGKVGSINFLAGTMGIANAERTLSYLRTITEYISQPEVKDVVPLFGIINEVLLPNIGEPALKSFYTQALQTIRDATGTGAGNGPYVIIHDGFQGPSLFADFLPGADRLVLDQHPYLAFDSSVYTETMAQKKLRPCASFATETNASQTAFGVTVGGEFSGASTDCGFWLNGIGASGTSTSLTGADTCDTWDDWSKWDAQRITDVKQIVMSFMDATQNWFFWTWRIGVSKTRGFSSSPDWHYRLGLQQGWIPQDTREATGICALQVGANPFAGTFPPSATGAAAGGIAAAELAKYPWPPATISSVVEAVVDLPRYTATGTMVTLPAATVTGPSATTTLGSGWTNADDRGGAYVGIQGCVYPDTYAGGSEVPAAYASCAGLAIAAQATVAPTAMTSVAAVPAVPPPIAAPTATATASEAADPDTRRRRRHRS